MQPIIVIHDDMLFQDAGMVAEEEAAAAVAEVVQAVEAPKFQLFLMKTLTMEMEVTNGGKVFINL